MYVYVPRVRANAYQALTTPPRVFRDLKMCLRNIWTAPYIMPSSAGEAEANPSQRYFKEGQQGCCG